MESKGRNRRSWIIFLTLIGWVIYVSIQGTIECHKLEKMGTCTNAYVFSKKNVTKGNVKIEYRFDYKGESYKGKSYHDDKVNVGDYITVVFLESKPQIHRSNSSLKINCSCWYDNKGKVPNVAK